MSIHKAIDQIVEAFIPEMERISKMLRRAVRVASDRQSEGSDIDGSGPSTKQIGLRLCYRNNPSR
jgi:hypothetical protein